MISSFQEVEECQQRHQLIVDARKAAVEMLGGVKPFRAKLASVSTPVLDDTTYDSLRRGVADLAARKALEKNLETFYDIFEGCFPIKSERQPFEGFKHILTNSHFDAALEDKIQAKHREFLHILRDPNTAEPIGGLDFVAYAHKGAPPTAHSCYAFLTNENHGLGLARLMFQIRDQIVMYYLYKTAPKSLAKAGGFYTFSEQNDPPAMDTGSYFLDSATIDPVKRLLIWSHLAYSVIEAGYTQPPYWKGGESCDILKPNCYFREVKFDAAGVHLGPLIRPKEIPGELYFRHFRAYFLQSVVKDIDAERNDPTTQRLLADFRAAASQTLHVTSVEDRAQYLELWGARIEGVKTVLGDTRPNLALTIREQYERNKFLIDRMIGRAAQRAAIPSSFAPAQLVQ